MKNSFVILLLSTILMVAGCATERIDLGVSRSFKDSNKFVYDSTTHHNPTVGFMPLNNKLSATPIYFLDYKLSGILDEKVDAHSVNVTEFAIDLNDPNGGFKVASVVALGFVGAVASSALSSNKSYISCRFEGMFHNQKIVVNKKSECPDNDISCFSNSGTADAPPATRKIIKNLANECTDEVVSKINSIKTQTSANSALTSQ